MASRAKNYELLIEHFKVACEPYYYERENYSTGEMETKIKYSDMIDEDKSLLNLVLAYIKQAPKYISDEQQRQKATAKQEAKNKEKELQIEK